MDNAQPIIVKKIKKGGHGHHGGAWKVAFADFVTAMMAFFLLMWLLGSTTPEERAAISDYFQNPSAVHGPGGASTSMIKMGGLDKDKSSGKSHEHQQEEGKPAEKKVVVPVDRNALSETKRLSQLKSNLESAIQSNDALKKFKDQLLLDITAEGLRIQIIDKKNRPMFASGSAELKQYTHEILSQIATIINKVPNKISLTGHTDATPFRSFRGYTNWELSSERANASRRALVKGGLSPEKVAKVVGLSSTALFDKKNPRSPINRRISLIVMNKQTEDKMISEAKTLKSTLGVKLPEGTNPQKPITLGQPRVLGGKPAPIPLQRAPSETKPQSLNKPKLQTF
jgi:chemotaxis protein MotB